MSASPTHVEIRLEEPKPSFWKRILCCCCHRRKSKRLDMKRLEEPDANAQEPNAPNEDQTKAQDEEMKVLTLTDEDQTKAQDEEAKPIKEQEDANVVIVEVVEVLESNVVEEVKSKAEDEAKVKTEEPKEQAEAKAKADKAIEEPKEQADKATEEPKAEEPKAEEPKADEKEEPKEQDEPTNAKKRTASFYKNKKKNKNQKIQTNMISKATLSDSSSSEAPLSPEYVVVSPQAPKNPNK